MKVILLVDIKGKGKKDEIKDFPSGYANFLIKSNQATLVNDASVSSLNARLEEERRLQEEILKKALADKERIEKIKITLGVRLSSTGNIMGSITNKMLQEKLEDELGIKIDKRKITFITQGTKLGEFSAKVELHKEVSAILKYQLVEIK